MIARLLRRAHAARAIGLAWMLACGTTAASAQDAARTTPAWGRQDFEKALVELSNWGRWGADDQLGALNLVWPGLA